MKVIDFDRARIAWTTHDGSHGFWRIVAAVRRETDGAHWVLAPAVMAGDVYGRGRLPLQPPYSFQFIASDERHVILRETIDAASLQDTVSPHADTFRALTLDIPEIEVAAVSPDAARERWPLVARMSLAERTERWTVEFPVGHINVRDTPPAWQVETGPVVIPCELIDIPGAAKPDGLQLAHVFFNRLDLADVLAFGPLADGRRVFKHFARLQGVEIALLA